METFVIALNVINKLLDQFPSYEERKKERFKKAIEIYKRETIRQDPDHDLILYLKEDLEQHLNDIQGAL